MFFLDKRLVFPHPDYANDDGILAIGGDLSTERLLLAYQNGIFPWYEEIDPEILEDENEKFSEKETIIWWSPDPRMVLYPDKLKVSKSMRKLLRQNNFTVTVNKAFEDVIDNCQQIFRTDQENTWITKNMKSAYIELHKKGFAHSVEVWEGDELVGGLYGVNVGKVFCGESMFSNKSNTSKLAFIYLVRELEKRDYHMIDCQVYTEHLESLGAEEISREKFLKELYEFRDHEAWNYK
ncbi:MAG: leucyl/phenylalanyl-tRNA--protein transferase [Bacteroidota bacterium]